MGNDVTFLLVRSINAMRRRQPAVEAAATKECQFCATPIPLKATRCPQCTSQLAEATQRV